MNYKKIYLRFIFNSNTDLTTSHGGYLLIVTLNVLGVAF